MPDGAVYVGRPTKWGNPYKPGLGGNAMLETKQQCVDAYRSMIRYAHRPARVDQIQAQLRGRDLVCWCPLDQPCHADVLLELANKEGGRHA